MNKLLYDIFVRDLERKRIQVGNANYRIVRRNGVNNFHCGVKYEKYINLSYYYKLYGNVK